MGKPHKHAEFIIAWANGEAIQFRKGSDGNWLDLEEDEHGRPFGWHDWCEYRIKPEPEYPKSSLSEKDFKVISDECHVKGWTAEELFRAIADAAVARHCQDQEKENV